MVGMGDRLVGMGDRLVGIRHGVKYIEMYLNTNTFEGFKYKYF